MLIPPAIFKDDDIVNFLYMAFYLEIKPLRLDWIVRQGIIGVRITTNNVVFLISKSLTDYRRKCTEYANREIPEYWIIDPMNSKLIRLMLK